MQESAYSSCQGQDDRYGPWVPKEEKNDPAQDAERQRRDDMDTRKRMERREKERKEAEKRKPQNSEPRVIGDPKGLWSEPPTSQPAPRQGTAIACGYCRGREIRCSGFEASDDGRCTNCQRFQQECIFTPLSSQAQAFMPAHTAYLHLRNTGAMPPQRGGRPLYPQPGQPAIYGAHGQPLGPPMTHDPNYPPPPHGYPMPQGW